MTKAVPGVRFGPAARALALVLLAQLLLPATARAQVDRAALVLAGAKVFKIEVLRRQGGFSIGSGVLVGEHLVITNCHVTQDAVGIHVLRGDNRWRVEAQARDAAHDLCLLRVPDLQTGSPVPLGRAATLKVGQGVTAVGFTGGLGIQNSSGAVIGLHPLDGAPVIQSDNWFSSGASGGALFDDDLRLVGVLTFRLRGGAAHYFAAPAEWLQPMIEGRVAFTPVAPDESHQAPYWQRPAEQQPMFLRAAALERDRRWTELEALSTRWSEADAADAAPWAQRALALERLGRPADAQRALEQALSRAPDDAGLWLRLGRLHQQRGATQEAAQVRQRLQTLDPKLARELDTPAAGS
jgi:hypothetical protein